MTTVTITATAFCPGGGHVDFSVTGDKVMNFTGVDVAPLLEPISDDEAQAFLKVICKMATKGRTLAQAKALLQAGVTITV